MDCLLSSLVGQGEVEKKKKYKEELDGGRKTWIGIGGKIVLHPYRIAWLLWPAAVDALRWAAWAN